jgi:predicted lipoprotein with Yx(FWY)xxD motif
VTGQGVQDVWFVVHPDIASMAIANPVVQVSKDPKLGDILTNQGMTLYWFKNDTANTSTCTDQCAVNWPPLLVKDGSPQAGQGVSGQLAVIDRQAGTKQLTYNGMPLYFFLKDVRPGDTNGQGIKSVWSVVPPAGSTADVGAATPMPGTQSNANKW